MNYFSSVKIHFVVTPAVPRYVFLQHFPLAVPRFRAGLVTWAVAPRYSCQPRLWVLLTLALTPLTCGHLHAQAPPQALYKQERDPRSVATPHIAFIFFLCFSFHLFFLLLYTHLVYSCLFIRLRTSGPLVSINLAPLGTTAVRVRRTVPRTAHGRTGHHIVTDLKSMICNCRFIYVFHI